MPNPADILRFPATRYDTGAVVPPRDARGLFVPLPRIAPEWMADALTVVKFPGIGPVPFHRGTGLLIGWKGYGGTRPEDEHPNELVFGYCERRNALLLTGGVTYGERSAGTAHLDTYGGRTVRVLPLSTTRGTTRQIRGVW
jgi:hypothetical protein